VARYAVAALQDLLAYRRSFEPTLGQATRYGVGVAFGHGLQPDLDAEVALCTPIPSTRHWPRSLASRRLMRGEHSTTTVRC
jgi:hypothetical protein